MEEKEYTGWKYWTPSDEELVYLYQEGSCPLDLVENEYLIVKYRTDDSVAAIYKKKNGQEEGQDLCAHSTSSGFVCLSRLGFIAS